MQLLPVPILLAGLMVLILAAHWPTESRIHSPKVVSYHQRLTFPIVVALVHVAPGAQRVAVDLLAVDSVMLYSERVAVA